MTSYQLPSSFVLALLVASGCKGTDHAAGEQSSSAIEQPSPPTEGPRLPAVEAPPEPSAPTQAPPKRPVPTLDEIRRLYDEAGGNAERLGPVREQLDQFLAAHPDDPDALVLLAQAHLELGKRDESLAVAERCVTVAAQMAACWLTIGVIAEVEADEDRAIEGYRQYVELASEGRYATDARKALARLGAPVAAPGAVPAASVVREGTTISTALDAAVVELRLEANIESLRVCYRRALETRPELAGRITYALSVDPWGRAADVTISEDTIGNPKLAACTRAKLQGLRIPTPTEPGEVTFTAVFAP